MVYWTSFGNIQGTLAVYSQHFCKSSCTVLIGLKDVELLLQRDISNRQSCLTYPALLLRWKHLEMNEWQQELMSGALEVVIHEQP
ncbi:hypothetical protein TNIN_231791 [Trichonephila inaurata madagascariensis]|uniref:Uncharacterized protein n=1 Tax=Trichonephila inaurata madagascariensis TaxID=2747483 RepID=A0A8X6XJM3_9ARAC|nr:hypothetical protein TNIN_231791 [Trichonephila inaurata madagascariensis]